MPRAFRSLLLCEIRQRSKSQTSTQSLTIRAFFCSSAVIFPASSSQNQSSSSSQMKPNSPFILFCLTLLSYVSNLSLSADQYPQNCYPQNCSHLTNIAYPFWIRSLQPDYCGLPPFELNCSDDTPTLFMGKEHYRVLNISYKAQTLTVATAAGEECSFPLNDLSFDLTPFTVSLSNRQLIIAYNCTLAAGAGTTEIDCASGRKRFAFLGGNYGAPTDEGMFGSCRTVVRPVMGYLGAKVEEYHELLANGFLLNWTAPDCTECRKSNGQCGYDKNTSNFMCICPDRAHFRSCSKEHSKKGLIIGVSTAVGVCLFMVCLVLCFLLYVYRKKNKRMSSTLLDSTASFQLSKSDPELGYSLHAPIFTYDELYEATDSFHASKELGDGGFGTVYKGKLRDGRVVAVKRLYESNYRRLEHFINEVKILSCLRHQNLVSLYGCTSRRSRELLLVYEFVPNGTVADHLHGPQSSGLLLPWKVRMSIAIETADALNYLHSVEPQIIHRDVKTNNILLDDNFHVKVADFGLSRLFPLDATHVSTAPQGTPGYLDPDYYQCYQLTVKSDVYSFGVVLMELISSMPAVDISLPRNEINLANRAINKIQSQELHELVDPRLGYQSDPSVNRMISQVAELAFQCLQSDGEMRPCIKDVLELLRGIACFGCEKVSCEEEDAALKEEDHLLESPLPCSPKSVTQGWVSRSTTPNTSW